MAKIVMTEEQCKAFIDSVFMKTIGKDFAYVIQAVQEKIERDKTDDA